MNPSLFASRKNARACVGYTGSSDVLPLIHASAAGAAPQGGIFYSVNTTSDTVVIGACQNGNPAALCAARSRRRTAIPAPMASGSTSPQARSSTSLECCPT